ncbi:MAG: phosphoribosylglycinamide formyltransferase [Phycisphaerales bacterium]|nr:phosphoribosylglycinamide formyltransferase [Phycisphaerales bacterium]
MLPIGVLISGGGSTLENLVQRIRDGRLAGVRIAQVVSSRSAVRGVEIARAAGLTVEIVRRRDFADGAAFSAAVADVLDGAEVELVAMGGFLCHWQLPDRYAWRVLNIHPALLPEFGGRGMYGRHVHEAVLAAGRRESGCTVHIVDQEYDHGPIVAQQRVPVLAGDTPDTLAERVLAAERELYPRVIGEAARRGVAWLRTFSRPGAGREHP